MEVSDAISHRANFGQIKVYSCKSRSRLHPQVDLSSWRGAEGACQVRRVQHAPAPPPTVEEQCSATKEARRAPHQTRAKVACWERCPHVGGDDDPICVPFSSLSPLVSLSLSLSRSLALALFLLSFI